MAPLRPVSAEEIESLAIGAWILGTGGGGSPYLALLNMRALYRQGAEVSLMDPLDLADDDLVAVVSNMGAPLVGQERLTDPQTIARAVTMMEEYLGRRFRAIMSLEIGGGNAIPPMAAALLDRPVVDADCMGRAFPEAQMTSFAIHDLRMYPFVLVDVRDNAVVLTRAASWKWMERLSRTACVAVGSIAATCKAPRTGKEVKECAILHSTSKAIRLGQTVQAARRAHRDPIEAIVEAEGGRLLFTGKIADVARRATEGFLRGTARLDGLGDCRGRRFELAFQNEFAVGWLDGAPRVMTPDLICVMDTVSGEAIGTETLRYGQRVSVVALPAPPVLLTPRGLGGGCFLVPERLPGVSEVVHVRHQAVANAVGAAIAQVSGEVDQIYRNLTRDAAIAEARRLAEQRAVSGGADGASTTSPYCAQVT